MQRNYFVMFIEDLISKIKPSNVLEIGCGCGSLTRKVSEYCKNIIATDVSEKRIKKCREEESGKNIKFMEMDAMMLDFKDDAFDLVFERDSLHHIPDWKNALDEMIRVSSKHIILSEPLDDNRSKEKINSVKAHELLIGVQKEAGYNHFMHLTIDQFEEYFKERYIKFNYFINRSDKKYTFQEFFESFTSFVKESNRYDYWMNELDKFRKDLGNSLIADSDTLVIEFLKDTE